MANKNIKEVEGGEVTTLSDTDGFEIDTGTSSYWIKWQYIKSLIATYYDSLASTLTNKTITAPTITTLTLDGKRFSIGTDPHSSPASGDLFYETDTAMLWTYGTYASSSRWVSVNKYSAGVGVAGALAVASVPAVNTTSNMFSHTGYDIYLDTMYFKHYVLTTNNGSNYWNITLRKVSGATAPASAAGTNLGSCNSSASSANTWTESSVSINAVIDGTGSGIEISFIDFTVTGTPGSVWFSIGVSYRLVRP